MNCFVYRLIPPRPTFGPGDMSDAEAAIMGEHAGYWGGLLQEGRAVVFGPVLDPSGTWGLAIVEADSEAEVTAVRDADPAVTSGLGTVRIFPMPLTVARPHTTPG